MTLKAAGQMRPLFLGPREGDRECREGVWPHQIWPPSPWAKVPPQVGTSCFFLHCWASRGVFLPVRSAITWVSSYTKVFAEPTPRESSEQEEETQPARGPGFGLGRPGQRAASSCFTDPFSSPKGCCGAKQGPAGHNQATMAGPERGQTHSRRSSSSIPTTVAVSAAPGRLPLFCAPRPALPRPSCSQGLCQPMAMLRKDTRARRGAGVC